MKQNYKGRLFDGTCLEVAVNKETISEVRAIPTDSSLPYLLPVLVDLQHNGAFGTFFSMINRDNRNILEDIGKHIIRHGVGRCLLTLPTYPFDPLINALQNIDEMLLNHNYLSNLFFALFQEGIFISPDEGWKGSHPRHCILNPDYNTFQQLNDASGNRIKMVNLAPEQPGGLDFIEKACQNEIHVALGHCHPTPEIVDEAVARGARFITHFANGAPPEIHRFNNPFWSFLRHDELKLGLICDGIHLPSELIKVVQKCKGPKGWFPVSDASGYSGSKPGNYTAYEDRPFIIEENRRIHLVGKETMMGAWFQMDQCVEILVKKTGMNFLDAWKQCSLIPAQFLNIKLPEIKVGEEASFVLAQWDEGLVIEQSVHLGKNYLDKSIRPIDI